MTQEKSRTDQTPAKDRREPWETPRVISSALTETEKFTNNFEGDPGDNNGFNS
jgi:hypothetical protein